MQLTNTEIETLLSSVPLCRLGLSRDNVPYVIPLYYAYELDEYQLTIYFETAAAGKKQDILRQNQNAFFEVDTVEDGNHKSVVGAGRISRCRDANEQVKALGLLRGRSPLVGDELGEDRIILKMFVIDFTGKTCA